MEASAAALLICCALALSGCATGEEVSLAGKAPANPGASSETEPETVVAAPAESGQLLIGGNVVLPGSSSAGSALPPSNASSAQGPAAIVNPVNAQAPSVSPSTANTTAFVPAGPGPAASRVGQPVAGGPPGPLSGVAGVGPSGSGPPGQGVTRPAGTPLGGGQLLGGPPAGLGGPPGQGVQPHGPGTNPFPGAGLPPGQK
jgi:hypothetical protein